MSILEHSHAEKTMKLCTARRWTTSRNYLALVITTSCSFFRAVQPTVRDGSNEPPRRGTVRRLHRLRRVGVKAIKEAKIIGKVNVIASTGRTFDATSGCIQLEVHVGRGLCSHHIERDDRGHAMETVPEDRCPTRGGHVVGYVVATIRSEPVRFDLRGAQKNLGRPESRW